MREWRTIYRRAVMFATHLEFREDGEVPLGKTAFLCVFIDVFAQHGHVHLPACLRSCPGRSLNYSFTMSL